jgi:hypothetical protein
MAKKKTISKEEYIKDEDKQGIGYPRKLWRVLERKGKLLTRKADDS